MNARVTAWIKARHARAAAAARGVALTAACCTCPQAAEALDDSRVGKRKRIALGW
jgi:hypothetical protein